jgi:preprotein translocase subunit SecD
VKTRAVGIALIALGIVLGVRDRGDAPPRLEFRLAETEPAPGLTEAVFSAGRHRRSFYLHDEIQLDERRVFAARAATSRGRPAVHLALDEEGRAILARLTGENVGRHLAMLVDGELLSAPRIAARIESGKLILEGDLSEARAREIAAAFPGPEIP